MTTGEDTGSKQRRRTAPPGPSLTEAPGPQAAQPIDLKAIRAIVAQELEAILDPIRDELAKLVTETRKTRVGLDASLRRFALLIDPQFHEDEAGEEEWLEGEDQEEQESQGEEVAANPFPDLHPRGRSGRTSFRAGLPVEEPKMLEILPRRQEGK